MRELAATNLVRQLGKIVGVRQVLTSASQTGRFEKGYRGGEGKSLAVVKPGTLVELWRTLQICVEADVIIILQAANTGLTGGSTPNGDYDRPVIIINTLRIKGIHLIDDARQVICMPGATLHELERRLEPFDREPHSVIGSSCIGASVLGGVCNNSGGALVQRGPAYTELALFARLDERKRLELVNHLGIALGDDPEDILQRVENGSFEAKDIQNDHGLRASDHEYCNHVRKIDEATPARYNADPNRLYEASGSAGKVAVFAVRLDTFLREENQTTFYIGSNSVADLAELRRDILRDFKALPIAGEYIHREAFDLADRYGKDTVIAIERLGTQRLPTLFALKGHLDALARKLPLLPDNLSDHIMQASGRLFGDHLPERMRGFRDRYEHHLILKMGGEGGGEARDYLQGRYPHGEGDFFECSKAEAEKAFLHRFAVAGAAVRYRAVHSNESAGIIALDIALRRNDSDWFEALPETISSHLINKLYYGHFFCNVFHQDYLVKKGSDPIALEHQMLEILDDRGAEYPAEHNVGHLYKAKEPLADFYRSLDPCNSFNPGIGDTPREANCERSVRH